MFSKRLLTFLGSFSLMWSSTILVAQTPAQQEAIQTMLNQYATDQDIPTQDVTNWIVTDMHTSRTSQVTHIYIQQTYQGIPVHNGVANFGITADNQVLSMGDRLIYNLGSHVNTTSPAMTAGEAITKALIELNLPLAAEPQLLEAEGSNKYLFDGTNISIEEIPVRLVFESTPEEELRLAWDLSIYTLDAEHWWSVRVDAQTGKLLSKDDWVSHCDFGTCSHPFHNFSKPNKPTAPLSEPASSPQSAPSAPDSYRVFPLPVEAPSFGGRSLVVNPADLTASPLGWHDTDGSAGAEYTITRGNNVFAYDDVADANGPGYSPDGTASLDFDFALDLNQDPSTYQDAAITNLFYMNNMMHDIWYHYGFDEASGNFQENNYNNGGSGGDYVNAEAQDGGGTNNANFATPPEGTNPRMQMYLWTGSAGGNALTVNTPAGISGSYFAAGAGFGPGLPATPLTADLALAEDGTAPINDACEAIINGADLVGKIAVIDRGTCNFTAKVLAAQNEGAVAAIIVNNVAGTPMALGGTDPAITIPSIMISLDDGNIIKQEMANGTVNATLEDPGTSPDKDGDLDNGIIAHEYGHGISTRLTGGANNSGCLSGDEQMGEGWSDWFAMMITMEPGDQAADARGMGTYAAGQPITGTGIRNAPYTTDMSINPYTYGMTNNTNDLTVPHGVGFVWATMLWDLTWALVDQYGFDADLTAGTGGNNMAMDLVMEGIKLQPCDPGFVDGRDAILQADIALFNGANQCLIWEVFARRGLGYSSSQGSSFSRTDQVEAFDIPPSCQIPVNAPVALFASNTLTSCNGFFSFEDQSTDIPQSWAWDFGDGNTSTAQNPTHTYANNGTYTVSLVVTNTLGADSTTIMVTVDYPDDPTASNVLACIGEPATLTATGTNTIQWYDAQGTPLGTGSPFMTDPITTATTFQVENVISYTSQFAAPNDLNFGGGNYHSSGFTGTVNFTADDAITIVSALVDADGAGDRTFYLWDAVDGTGNILDQITITVPDGQSRVALNFEIPAGGDYSIGGNNVDLYRHNSGVAYPYSLPGLMTITGSSAGPDYYYYFYDLEVQQAPCRSNPINVLADVIGADFGTVINNYNVQFNDFSIGATSWEWNFGDGNTSTMQNPNHTYGGDGLYVVTLTINGSCTFMDTLGIGNISTEDVAYSPSISILPNPATTQATIQLNNMPMTDMHLELMSIDGRMIQHIVLPVGTENYTLDLQALPAAVYFIKLSNENWTETRKLVIKR